MRIDEHFKEKICIYAHKVESIISIIQSEIYVAERENGSLCNQL